jgi:sigma-B regulation protein RsbU (phosphoserine phosphatase)
MDQRLDASRLASLLESAKVLGSSLELDQQLNHLLRTVMGRLLATRAVIALGDAGSYRVAAFRGIPGLRQDDELNPVQAKELGLNCSFAIGEGDAPWGYLAVSDPAGRAADEAEGEFVRALAVLSAASISNARAHQETLRRNQELRAMLELSTSLSGAIEPEEVAQRLMLTLAGRWAVLKYGFVTWKEGVAAVRRLKGLTPPVDEEIRAAIEGAESAVRMGEMLAFPLRVGDAIIGAALLGPAAVAGGLSDGDLEFGCGLASLAAGALDNAWRVQDSLFRQRIERELSLAASIQLDLFPKSLPKLRATELSARNRPAREVGGDYYDVLSMGGAEGGGPHLLAVADISGKGVGASLLMANIQATLRALLSVEQSLEEVARQTSELLYASTPPSKYATAILVKYDPSSGRCTYINAGHNEGLILRRTGEVERLGATSIPMALLPGTRFPEKTFDLAGGDILLLYSDGVTDAVDPEGEEYGTDRLIEMLARHGEAGMDSLIDGIFLSIEEFASGQPQHDDITMLALRRVAAGGVR